MLCKLSEQKSKYIYSAPIIPIIHQMCAHMRKPKHKFLKALITWLHSMKHAQNAGCLV